MDENEKDKSEFDEEKKDISEETLKSKTMEELVNFCHNQDITISQDDTKFNIISRILKKFRKIPPLPKNIRVFERNDPRFIERRKKFHIPSPKSYDDQAIPKWKRKFKELREKINIHIDDKEVFETLEEEFKRIITIKHPNINADKILFLPKEKNQIALENTIEYTWIVGCFIGLTEDNHIKSLDCIGFLKEMKIIQIWDIIKDFSEIISIGMGYCNIESLGDLENIKTLQSLNLQSNEITDIRGLRHLTSLEKLVLSGNQINSIDALDTLSNLKELYLKGNMLFYQGFKELLIKLTKNHPQLEKVEFPMKYVPYEPIIRFYQNLISKEDCLQKIKDYTNPKWHPSISESANKILNEFTYYENKKRDFV
jgi:hypothetical protein